MILFSAVSIHALAWSATLYALQTGLDTTVSIHALAWSATSDTDQWSLLTDVSIHALAWSATGGISKGNYGGFRFQSTRSHGARLY